MMDSEDLKPKTFIKERLDSLYEADCKVVTLLDSFSSLFETYSVTQKSEAELESMKQEITTKTSKIYSLLSEVAIQLRREVQIMDENIGTHNENSENRMILPISVEQKNTTLGDKKLEKLIDSLSQVVETSTTHASNNKRKSNGLDDIISNNNNNDNNDDDDDQTAPETVRGIKEENEDVIMST